MPPRSNANARHRERIRRAWWIGGGAAIAIHAGLLFATPAFEINGHPDVPHVSRMVLYVDGWSQPVCGAQCPNGYLHYDTVLPPPEVTNHSQINYRLPRTYPWLLWKYKEASSLTVQVAIRRAGNVSDLKVLESSDNGADEALIDIANGMRFYIPQLSRSFEGIVATVRVTVSPPL